ncbi:MAG: 16S rRNA (cytosine(967)-C(5))-methyltransferase RsmB [Pseudomonadota bacterium]|nr:16S rRNA (cytosine(967)-C(5))-methyltransferase RsmB [Pseudomonadota bacterium]
MQARHVAVRALTAVLDQDKALNEAFDPSRLTDVRERALAREICYGTLRWYPRLAAILDRLLRKPVKPRDRDVAVVILTGLYQLSETRVAAHAAVNETVRLAGVIGKPWARGLVNAVLRGYQRHRKEIDAELAGNREARYAHPVWLLDRLKAAYPDAWERVCEAGNQRPPMTLRVNRKRYAPQEYLGLLRKAGLDADPVPGVEDALILRQAVDVGDLPGFSQGAASVQDASAQLAAGYLDCQSGMRVLDACAAPGGKTAHILEIVSGPLEVCALDKQPNRMRRLEETLDRLGLHTDTMVADAAATRQWWNGEPFDRILLDAPCSATGIIRRQPDVKVRRRPSQLPGLVRDQQRLLDSLWPLLKQGGMLLYATCSVLPEENRDVIRNFVDRHPDADTVTLMVPGREARVRELQILPGDRGMDGFYYALLQRR